jgi:hypothetical protein
MLKLRILGNTTILNFDFSDSFKSIKGLALPMIKEVRFFRIIIVLLITGSCETSPSFYKKNDVELLYSQLDSDSLTIIYSTPLEGMYYSSGILYEYNKHNELTIRFLRSTTSEKAIKGATKSYLIQDVSDSLTKIYPPTSYLARLPNYLNQSCVGKGCIIISD